MSSCIGKNKPSKKFQSVSRKVDGYYEKFHSINNELKNICEHNAVIPDQRRRRIINDFFPFKEQISYIIETRDDNRFLNNRLMNRLI